MSLTGLLKSNSEEGIFLRNIISTIKIDINEISKDVLDSEIQAKYLLKDHSLASQVGTAFDYLARFVLKHYQNKVNGIAFNEEYVAKYGLKILFKNTRNKKSDYQSSYDIALNNINKYINGDDSLEAFDKVIEASIYFAKLENFYRGGYTYKKEMILNDKTNFYVKQELINQIEIFKDIFDKKFDIKSDASTIYYNPTFGICSLAVGGADADIIINDTLVDFKSSKYLKSIDEDYKQLLGYYLFSRVINGPTNINKICLYFSRYGKFVEYRFNKKDLVSIEIATKQMKNFIHEFI